MLSRWREPEYGGVRSGLGQAGGALPQQQRQRQRQQQWSRPRRATRAARRGRPQAAERSSGITGMCQGDPVTRPGVNLMSPLGAMFHHIRLRYLAKGLCCGPGGEVAQHPCTQTPLYGCDGIVITVVRPYGESGITGGVRDLPPGMREVDGRPEHVTWFVVISALCGRSWFCRVNNGLNSRSRLDWRRSAHL